MQLVSCSKPDYPVVDISIPLAKTFGTQKNICNAAKGFSPREVSH